MPEGDTIHRTAAALRHALVGQHLGRVELPRASTPLPAVGATVDTVSARGKHLLIRTSDGLTLHTHLRMNGSWHLYRQGQRWRRSSGSISAVLGVETAVAVCFSAPIVEVLTDRQVERHPVLQRLGPDLCVPEPDLDEVLRRVERLSVPDRPVGDLLLDQRIASGIGNVYRSELLFLHGLHPGVLRGGLDATRLRALFSTAAELLRHNVATRRRTTTPRPDGDALWVYGRAGKACRRCGSTIELATFGDHARIVFWCPSCQSAPNLPLSSR